MGFGVLLFPAIHLWLNYAFVSVKKAYNEWFLPLYFLLPWYNGSLSR